MIEFKILKKSKRSQARLGIIKTDYGFIETPSLVPVATQAVVKTLTSEEVIETKTQILIANTFHLHLKPGEKIIKSQGGLHKFMNWQHPLMTDSGGFQVFSLGFGRDFDVGKILRCRNGHVLATAQPPSERLRWRCFLARPAKRDTMLARSQSRAPNMSIPTSFSIRVGQQPKLLKITNEGVIFTSPLDGQKIFLGPKESIKIQESLGADIIFAFDECTSPTADYAYTKNSLSRTHQWTKICLSSKYSKQALFGIIQGGKYKDLRIESAKFIGSLDFDGFGIGGEFGDDKKIMAQIIDWAVKELPEEKPRHLLGIGHLEDIPKIIKEGIDTFDCIVPTHYARHGIAFTSQGKLDMQKSKFLKDKNPLDKKCSCSVCQNYSRSYITHLLRAKEITASKLLTFHNLYFFNSFIEKIRKDIKNGKI